MTPPEALPLPATAAVANGRPVRLRPVFTATCACGLAAVAATTSSSAAFLGSLPSVALPQVSAIERAREVPLPRASASAGASSAMPLAMGITAGLVSAATVAATQTRRLRAGELRRPQGSVIATRVSIMQEEVAEEVDVEDEEQNALVKKTSVLVLGGTGTLGRQVVRLFLKAGYNVRCMVRNRADRPFAFLTDWGASLVEGSLARPETIPGALVGIHTVIDCATARPEESAFTVDWEGKKRFIQCCEKMKIQRYVFLSIQDCDKNPNVPLMNIKFLTEKFLAKSKLRHTVLRVTGYMQPLVSQYAVSILDKQKVWGDDGTVPGLAYIDSQDCARMVAAAAMKDRTLGKTLTVSGPKVWSTQEVIKLCEKLSGREADVNVIPTNLIELTQGATSLFDWSRDIAERLSFVQGQPSEAQVMSEDTYRLLGYDPASSRKLDEYFAEFYRRVFKNITKTKSENDEEAAKAFDKIEEGAKTAFIQDFTDSLPPGQEPERDVKVVEQRKIADKLQTLLMESQLEAMETPDEKWFGWTKVAQLVNGRSAMMGFSLGLFTEWATGVSVQKQVDLIIDLFNKY